jgi:hypothetical protein
MILGILDETYIHGMIEDESETTETTSKYMAFRNDDEADEALANYYESQDYSYRVRWHQIAKISDVEIPEIIQILNGYIEAMDAPGICEVCDAHAKTSELCTVDDRLMCYTCFCKLEDEKRYAEENTTNGIDVESYPELARESRRWS